MLLQCSPAARRRAIIDIGSNSIRLVVYPAERRIPASLINEKVSARLGKTLQENGRLPEAAMDTALRGLARFAAIAAAAGAESLTTVATAAVRDAVNGAEFLDRVRELGLAPALLSGSEEAIASAQGVLCAFPHADGVVADLGGGSLELVDVARGEARRPVTLPLGTLRLATMREKSTHSTLRRMRSLIEAGAPAGMGEDRPLYLVGGSWRALAHFAMHEVRWPVPSPHGFVLQPKQVGHYVSVLSQTSHAAIKAAGVSAQRAPSLLDATLVLSALVRHLRPDRAIVSGFGLREGLAFAAMPSQVRRGDPLLADLADQLGPAAAGTIYGEPVHRWAGPLFTGESPSDSRLRLAASWLGYAVRQPDRAVRPVRAIELALHENWIGVEAVDRARIAAALLTFVGEKELPADLRRLCGPADLAIAMRWGWVMRLAEKLSAGLGALLLDTSLRSTGGRLELALGASKAIYGEAAQQQHAASAAALGLAPALATALSTAPAAPVPVA